MSRKPGLLHPKWQWRNTKGLGTPYQPPDPRLWPVPNDRIEERWGDWHYSDGKARPYEDRLPSRPR